MPHRRQYRRDVGVWATLIGIYCIYLGLTWFLFPTNSRISGIEWINESTFPVDWLNAYHVATWWLIGGILSILGGIFSKHKWCNAVAVVSSIFFPSIVAVIFFGSWVDGSTETELVSTGTYFFPAIVMVCAIWRESSRLRRGLIELPMSDVTGETEVVK